MASTSDLFLRQQLLDRQFRLEQAVSVAGEIPQVRKLIHDVDAALARMESGSYGLCEVCHEPIEADRLINDPLTRFCLDHLTVAQQKDLENDLELAGRIQRSLLPDPRFHFNGWDVAYHYEPAAIVSGDYCGLITAEDGDFYFIIGDVTGKGVAASMLMVHLHAMFKTLIPMELPLPELVARASRVFCESTLPTHYATLVCARAGASGEVEICNAGHLPPLVIGRGGVRSLEATGLPLGAFCDEQFGTSRIRVEPGEAILLYTDGLSEARDSGGRMYGTERLLNLVRRGHGRQPQDMIGVCLRDLASFRKGIGGGDDLTIMAVGRSLVS
jgi:sigma-B regulation protein RsbU (phosphoserine phosphatase)